jgi:hypothetical protein
LHWLLLPEKNYIKEYVQDNNMASIPGIIYLLLGLAVSISSFIINRTATSNSLLLFMWIGIVFIGIGIIKLVVAHLKKKQEIHSKHNHSGQHTVHPGYQHPIPPVEHQTTQQSPNAQHAQHMSSVQHPLSAQQHARTSPEQYATPSKSVELQSEKPRNKMEDFVLWQVEAESKNTAHHDSQSQSTPPIVVCPHCQKRQYQTAVHCYSCKRLL